LFAGVVIAAVFAFLQFTTSGMVVRAGMADRETVGLLGIDIDRRFTIVFGIAAIVAGVAGVIYTPIPSPDSHMGMEFLVLSFVVGVMVGGMGSFGGAVMVGFLAGHPAILRLLPLHVFRQCPAFLDQLLPEDQVVFPHQLREERFLRTMALTEKSADVRIGVPYARKCSVKLDSVISCLLTRGGPRRAMVFRYRDLSYVTPVCQQR
jgi:hypothetical protein